MKIGSHVGMSGKEMLLGSAKEAASYGANVFMAYTGAPQNTRRKEISELNIDKAWEYMDEHGIDEVVIHAVHLAGAGRTGGCRHRVGKIVSLQQVGVDRAFAASGRTGNHN